MKKFYIGLLLSGFVFQQSYSDAPVVASQKQDNGFKSPYSGFTFRSLIPEVVKQKSQDISDYYARKNQASWERQQEFNRQYADDRVSAYEAAELAGTLKPADDPSFSWAPKRWADALGEAYSKRQERLKDEALDRLIAQQDVIALRDYQKAEDEKAAVLRLLKAKEDMLEAKSKKNREYLEKLYFKKAKDLQAAGPLTESDAAQLEGLRKIAFGDRPVPVFPEKKPFDWSRFYKRNNNRTNQESIMRADQIVSDYEQRVLEEEMNRQKGQEELRQLEMSIDRERAEREKQRLAQSDLTGTMTLEEWNKLQEKRDEFKKSGKTPMIGEL